MKRDLASVLGGQSQLADSLVGTRAESSEASPCLRVYERLNSKRFKGAIVNGLIVYTRARKSGINGLSEACGSRRLDEPRYDGSISAQGFESDQLTEVEVRDEGSSSLEIPRSRGGPESEPSWPLVEDHDIDGDLVEVVVREVSNCSLEMSRHSSALDTSSEGGRDSQVRSSRGRRFTRSTLRPSSEPPEENGSETVPAEVVSDVEEEKLVEVSTLLSNNKLELKMSKKVVLDRKPTTVKELFDTGLVDGVTVIYMGSKKVAFDYYYYFFVKKNSKLMVMHNACV